MDYQLCGENGNAWRILGTLQQHTGVHYHSPGSPGFHAGKRLILRQSIFPKLMQREKQSTINKQLTPLKINRSVATLCQGYREAVAQPERIARAGTEWRVLYKNVILSKSFYFDDYWQTYQQLVPYFSLILQLSLALQTKWQDYFCSLIKFWVGTDKIRGGLARLGPPLTTPLQGRSVVISGSLLGDCSFAQILHFLTKLASS